MHKSSTREAKPMGGNKGGDLPGKVQCFLIEVLTKLLVEMSKGFGVSKGRKAASATRSQCYRRRRESSDGTESVVILLLWPSCLSSNTATENTQNIEKIPQNPFQWLFKKQVNGPFFLHTWHLIMRLFPYFSASADSHRPVYDSPDCNSDSPKMLKGADFSLLPPAAFRIISDEQNCAKGACYLTCM